LLAGHCEHLHYPRQLWPHGGRFAGSWRRLSLGWDRERSRLALRPERSERLRKLGAVGRRSKLALLQWAGHALRRDRCQQWPGLVVPDGLRYGVSVAAGAGSVFSSASPGGLHYGTSSFTATNANTWQSSNLLYLPAGGTVGVGAVKVTMSANRLNHRLEKRCVRTPAIRTRAASVRITGPNTFAKTLRFDACALLNAAAVVKTFDLLDPGDHTVTVKVGKRSRQATFTVNPDRTTKVNLKLSPRSWSQP